MALPSINSKNLAAAVQAAQFTPSTNNSGDIFCKFDYKTGDYLLGREADNIAGEEVVIHTDSIAIGWVCWSGGKPHKQLVSFIEPLPMQPEPMGADHWSEARAIMFKTAEGEQVTLEGNSYGIRSGIDNLITAIKQRASDPANADYLYPKVKLSDTSYKHTAGNTIHNMVLDVVGWCDVEGNLQADTSAKAIAAEPEEEVKPTRRRRAA